MRVTRRAVVCVALWATAPFVSLLAAPLHASVAIELSVDRLVEKADAVVVAVPLEKRAAWRGGRIYTYARLRIETTIAGSLSRSGETWVRTRGGVVGELGQWVDGEAILVPDQPSVLFLRETEEGVVEVVGRAQGQYRVLSDGGAKRVQPSPNVAALLPDRQAHASGARRALGGKLLEDAAAAIRTAWRHAHAE